MKKDRNSRIYGVTVLGIIANALLLAFKFVAGIIGCSSAMVADAVHSLSDFVTDIIVLVFIGISNKPADKGHDYGHGKYETLASSLIGLILLFIGAGIGWKGLEKIITIINGGTLESPDSIALIAAIASILIKEAMYRITIKVAKDVDSPALKANALHHRSDALSSVGTALGIGGAILLGEKWVILDPIAAVIVSAFIIISALKIIRNASGELLEESLPAEMEKKIENIALKEEKVSDVHNLRTRRIGSRVAIEMHLRMPGKTSLDDAHEHVSHIEKALRAEFGEKTHIMIHFEPVKTECCEPETNK